jgi:hypothetical protein
MLVVDQLEAVLVDMDLSTSGLPRTQVSRVTIGGEELITAVEWLEPGGSAPTQLQVCDYCGTVGCASGGYAQLSLMADGNVLVSPPRLDRVDGWEEPSDREWLAARFDRVAIIGRHGSAVIRPTAWNAVGLPSADQLPRTQRMDVYLAWVAELRPQPDSRIAQHVLDDVCRRLIASHPATSDIAVEAVRSVADELLADPAAAVHGVLRTLDDVEDRATGLYLGEPDCTWWYADLDAGPAPAFDGRFSIARRS